MPTPHGQMAAADLPGRQPNRQGQLADEQDDRDRRCEDRDDEHRPRTDEDSDDRCAALLLLDGGLAGDGAHAGAASQASGSAWQAGATSQTGTGIAGSAAADTAAGTAGVSGTAASSLTGTASAAGTTGALHGFTAASMATGAAVLLGGISAVASSRDTLPLVKPGNNGQDNIGTQKPAVQAPAQTVPYDGEHTLDAGLFSLGVTGKSVEYVVLQRVTANKGSAGTSNGSDGNGGTGNGGSDADGDSGGLWLRHEDGSAPTRLLPGSIIAKSDFGRVFWSAERNAGGEFQFVASDAKGVPLAEATPQIVSVQELPPIPQYPEQPATHAVAHDQAYALDSRILAGSDPKQAPAGGVRIDSIETDRGDGSTPALYLKGDDGTLTPIAAGTYVALADFGRLVWDSTHNEGGRFSFTAFNASGAPVAAQQTVILTEAPIAPEYPDDLGFKTGYNVQHAIDGQLFAGKDPAHQPPAVRILSYAENDDRVEALPPLYIQYPGQRVFLKPGDLIRAEDFGKVRWDAMNSEGGTFRFQPVDAGGADVPGWKAHTVTVREYPDYPEYPDGLPTHIVPLDGELALPATVFTGTRPASSPAFIRITAIDAAIQDGSGAPPMLVDENGQLTPIRVGDIIPAAQFSQIRWDASHNGGGSFEFVALDAEKDPLPHLPPQVVQVHESPAAPVYEANTVVRVAHDGIASLQGSILGGSAPEHRPAQVRIDRIAPEGDTDAARPALYIERDGKKEPLQAGSIVDRADFSLLRWDAGNNQGGQFGFTALDDSGLPILNASREPVSQTVTLRESPEGPVYDDDTPLLVAHDQVLQLDAGVLAGSDPARAPAFVKIVAVDPRNPDAGSTGALKLVTAAAPDGEPVTPGKIISASEFGNLRWDSAHNEGGTFRFIPLDADEATMPGIGEETVIVRESPLPPAYDSAAATLEIEQNLPHTLGRALFEGTDQARVPAFIAITRVSIDDAQAGHAGGLMIRHPDGSLKPLGSPPVVLAPESLDRLVWDSTGNTGGQFTFEPLDSAYMPILDANEHVISRTITIHEPAVLPDYPATREALNTPHDGIVPVAEETFTGSTPNKAPAKIRITAVNIDNHQTPDVPALQLDPDGRGATAASAVKAGQIIDAADFGKLSWNADGNDGGSFTFVPLDARGNEIPGAAPQTVTIHEDDLPVPQYEDPRALILTPHDQSVSFGAETFIGTIPGNAPPKIRITAINAQNDAGQSAPTGNTLQLDRDGDGGEAPEQVRAGQLIDQADFGKLSWNATGNAGGSFSFEAVDAHGNVIPSTQTQTVTVHESPVAPTYAGTSSTVNTAGGWAHPFSKIPGAEAKLLGTDAAHRPAYFMIEEVNPINPVTPSGAAAQAASQSALYLRQDGQGAGGTDRIVPVTGAAGATTVAQLEQSIIAAGDLGKLHWNGQINDGGSFRLTALDADRLPILGPDGQPVTQTIQVNELPNRPQYEVNGSNAIDVRVAHDYTDFVLKPHLFAGETDELGRPPAQVRIDGFAVAGTTPPQFLKPTGIYLLKDGQKQYLKQGDTIKAADYDKVRWDSTQNDGNVRVKIVALDEHGNEILKNPDTVAHRYLDIREDAFDLKINNELFRFQHDAYANFSTGSVLTRFRGNGSGHVFFIRIDEIDVINAKPGSAAMHQGMQVQDPAVNVGDILNLNGTDGKPFRLVWLGSDNDGGSFRFTPLDAQGRSFIDHDGNEISRVITVYESSPRPGYLPPEEANLNMVQGQDNHIDPKLVIGTAPAKAPKAIRFDHFTETNDTAPDQSPVYVLRDGHKVYLSEGDVIQPADFKNLYWDAHHNQGGSFSFTGLDLSGERIFNTNQQTVTVGVAQPSGGVSGKGVATQGEPLQLEELASPRADTPADHAMLTGAQAAPATGSAAPAAGSTTPLNLWHGTSPLVDELQPPPLV